MTFMIVARAKLVSLRMIWLPLSLLLFVPAAVSAQMAPTPPVPLNVDERGVNLTTGSVVASSPGLSIGPADQHGLQLSMQYVGSWVIRELPAIVGSTTNPIVYTGGQSIPFTGTTSSYAPVYQDGSTLAYNGGNYIYTGGDGTKIEFGYVGYQVFGSGAGQALAQKITYPDGTVRTFTWETASMYVGLGGVCYNGYCYPVPIYQDVARLSSINSSTGYQIKMTYGYTAPLGGASYINAWFSLASATAINNAVEYCDPTAGTCSLTNTWPTMTYGYGTSGGPGLPSQVTDPVGRTTTYSYVTGLSTLKAIRPPGASADTVTFCRFQTTCDDGYKVTKVTANGSDWNYAYYTASNYTEVANPNSQTTRFVYNGSSQITAVVDLTTGLYTSYGYCGGGTGCPAGLLQTVTMPELNYTSYVYDARGNATSATQVGKPGSGATGISTSATYPSSCPDYRYCNKPTSTTDANGNVTNYNYDTSGGLGTGNLLSVVAPAPSGGATRPITVYSYGTRQAYYKNYAGSIVASGQNILLPTQVSTCRTTGASSGTTTTLPCSTTDEVRTTVDYGPQTSGTANNLNPVGATVSRGDGALSATSAVTYDIYARAATADGPLSNDTSSITYNLAGQVETQVAPDPDDTDASLFPATKYHYDGWGHADYIQTGTVTNLAGSGWSETQRTEYEFDSYGRTIRQKAQSAGGAANYQISETVYDALGRVQCTRVRMDMSNIGYATDGCSTIQTTGANGPDRVTHNTYDSFGRVIQVREGYGTSDEAVTTMSFTANGKPEYMIDAKGASTAYGYNGYDWLAGTYFPSTSLPGSFNPASQSSALSSKAAPNWGDTETMHYDANGNVIDVTTRRGETLNLTYDHLNRLTVKDVPARSGLSSTYTRDVYYGYDLLGHLTNAMFDSATGGTYGEGITNHYDALGRLTDTTLAMDGTFSKQLAYTYDVAGNRSQMFYPAADGNRIDYWRYSTGMFNVPVLNGTSYLFAPRMDAQGRMSWLGRWNTSAANWTEATGIGYDAISRLSAINTVVSGSSGVYTSFTYNPAGQILSRTQNNDNYAWTGAASLSRGYAPNGLNQYSAVGGTSFSYDSNGNLTSAPDPSGATQSYVYDVENRLVSRSSASSSATMRYDPLGRLYETVGSNTGITRFLYDGDDLVAEYDSSGNVLRRYVHGMGVDQPLVWFEGSGVLDTARHYLYADERGSIVAVTDSVGAVQSINRYDEYGIPDLAGSIGVEISTKGRFRYTGQAYIPEMGMYYYKARMYSPTLGRFMQTDPIGYGDGANMYNYVRSDPVNGADPSGLIRNGTNTCSNASIAPPPQGWICSDGEWVQGFEINGISCHTDPTQWACATPGVSYVDPSTFLKNFGMNSVNPGTSYSGDGGGTASQGVCPPGTAANTGGKADFSGVATMYGETIKGKADQFAGETTASGEKMDPDAMTAASVRLRDAKGNLQRSPLIRLGTSLVVSLVSDSSKSIVVRINDTGPLRPGRILDLTPAAMKALTGKAYNEVSVNAYRCKPVPQ